MGTGYRYECHKCGYTFSQMNGIGYTFPTVYAKTVQQAKAGELGEQIQQFFKQHPEGAINAENVTICCESCGDLITDKDLTMYIPKKAASEGRKFIMPDELAEHYEEYAKYPHICKKCGGEMRVLGADEELLCPECKTPLSQTPDTIMWD